MKKKVIASAQQCGNELYAEITLKKSVGLFILNAILVVVAAIFLPKIGEGIAEITGLGQTFVGNILIAFSTSLPETVVCFGALKCKAVDLAIGNITGSTIFNITILGIIDFIYSKAPLLSSISPNHSIPALSAIIMTTIVIISTGHQGERKKCFFSSGILLLSVYLMNVLLLYLLKK
ncbi:MAG: hypothetical protein N3A65_00355 [candidate division WOR-3 bacterium]|nr:hypothetical protein [candidate division WOR-3 bacterium]